MASNATIETSRSGFYDAPLPRVYVSDTLRAKGEGKGWQHVPYLYLDRLRRAAAPEIDQAELAYDYGILMRPDKHKYEVYPPQSLNGKFVWVEIPDTTAEEMIDWFGVIELDERNVAGSTAAPTGQQRITAYGLLRLLERITIRHAIIQQGAEQLRLDRGLPFNVNEQGAVPDRGNRASEIGADGTCYRFSDDPRGGEKWTARQAVDYLVATFVPVDHEGNFVAPLSVDAQLAENGLDWYDVDVETDGRTLKEVFDELINRRRGVGYFVDFDGSIKLNVFTFNDEELELPTGEGEDAGTMKIGANPISLTLNFEDANDVETAVVRNAFFSRYDRVIALGEYETTTCTLRFMRPAVGPNKHPELIPDWTEDDRVAYVEGATQLDGYGDLDDQEQWRRNAVLRAGDQLAHVFSRFRLSPKWDQTVAAFSVTSEGDDPHTRYWVDPPRDASGKPQQPFAPNKTAPSLWIRGLKFLPQLVLKQGLDYSGLAISKGEIEPYTEWDPETTDEPERPNMPVMVFVSTDTDASGNPSEWRLLDKLSATVASEDEARRWSAHVHVSDRAPVLNLKVSGGPQHFLAPTDFLDLTGVEDFGECDERDDPETQFGLDWTKLQATVSIELARRVSEEARIKREERVDERQERTLYLPVKGARLDYVVPGTIVLIHDAARLLSNLGGFIRDDRPRLKRIARAALEWYGKERQAITLSFKQVRNFVHVGDLIVDVGATYNLQDVRSVVTALTYDFTGECPKTTLETSYAELDFA